MLTLDPPYDFMDCRSRRGSWLLAAILSLALSTAGPWSTHRAFAQQFARSKESVEVGSATLERIKETLLRGDFDGLVQNFSDRVDLTIFGTSELLSRSQAKYVVKEFFRRYPPRQVILNKTTPSDGNWFASASYWHHDSVEPFLINIRMRAVDGRWELRELRISTLDGR